MRIYVGAVHLVFFTFCESSGRITVGFRLRIVAKNVFSMAGPGSAVRATFFFLKSIKSEHCDQNIPSLASNPDFENPD